jgi:hypothetical protein
LTWSRCTSTCILLLTSILLLTCIAADTGALDLEQPLKPFDSFGVRIHYSETVQIAQLHQRAILLDAAFKAKVRKGYM